ncbi:hypothetical protein GTQ99_22755, partial [Kineococcus sp. T13]|uniref:histidine kinase n=1 Tax=Kineococcus vitellinus TaxID=2696565 RepID=UPI001411CFEA|nr:hypothetical protein [Kineococcus vitellinus]
MPARTRPAGRPTRSPRAPRRALPAPWTDTALALVLALVDLTTFSAVLPAGTWWQPAYLLLGFAALPWRRRAAGAVFAAVWLHLLGAVLLVPQHLPVLALLLALGTVASRRGPRAAAVASLLAVVLYVPASTASEVRSGDPVDLVRASATVAVLFVLLLGSVTGLGLWTRRGRQRVTALEAQRERAAQEAVTAERHRVARELHDVVSHSVSTMVLQAAGARRVLAADPARAGRALAEIEGLGKESMSELRRLLGVLRDGALVEGGLEEAEDAEEGALRPRPGLSRLPELLDACRGAGLHVRHEVVGRAAPLDGSVDLSAYRVVQEALTNACKHAGAGTAVRVREVWSQASLLVEVVDDGRGAGAAVGGLSTGHGLLGLRERVRAVGGRLEAGAVPGGGYRVGALLPLRLEPAPDHRRARAGAR